MYIDSMTITAIIVFAVALVVFVKQCILNSCMLKEDREHGDEQ